MVAFGTKIFREVHF